MYIENLLKQLIEDKDTTKVSYDMINSSYNYDHMVYIRLFEGCNLNCEHCFIPSNPKKIESSFYHNNGLTELLMKYTKVKEWDTLYLQWHGGEPTLLGPEYLENAIQNIMLDKRFKYINGIQTNLINFNKNTEKWVQLYKNYFNSTVGISWDYGIRHIKSSALTTEKTNADFENRFWNNVKLAQEHGLDLYMVITATKVFFEHFKNPFDFFELMVEKGITQLNLERITKTGYARESWNKLGLSNKEYSTYMSKFFKAYCLFKDSNPDIKLNISPFDGLTQSVLKLKLSLKNKEVETKSNVWDILSYKNQAYGCWSGVCDTKFHTIDSNGYKHGCTALTSEQDNKNKVIQKNIDIKKITWVSKKENNSSENSILLERKNRQKDCLNCEFYSICSSGCLSVEKFDESLECSGGKLIFETINNYVSKVIKQNNL